MSTDMSVDIRTKHQLSQIAQASAAFQRSCGSAQYQPSKSSRVGAVKPKPIPKMPPRRKQGAELNKMIIGSVGGVLRHRFGGSVKVMLNDDSVPSWSAADHSVRVNAMVEELSPLVVEYIDNPDGKIADPTRLLEKVQIALRLELWDRNKGTLRVEPFGFVDGVYEIKVKPVKKVRTGDGRPAKQAECMKTAMNLRRRRAA